MSESVIVRKVDQSLSPESFDVTAFKRARPGEKMQFEVNVIAESERGMRKKALVEPNLPSWGTFELICDEGLALGGEDTAPPPLGYLASGIAFCLLTHLSSYIRAKKLVVNNVRVEQRMLFSTSLVTDAEKSADLRGNCDGLETYVLIDSPEPREKIQALIEVSESACMALQSIVNQVPQSTKVRLNGEAF